MYCVHVGSANRIKTSVISVQFDEETTLLDRISVDEQLVDVGGWNCALEGILVQLNWTSGAKYGQGTAWGN